MVYAGPERNNRAAATLLKRSKAAVVWKVVDAPAPMSRGARAGGRVRMPALPGVCSKPKSTCSDTVAHPDYVMRLGLRGITYADHTPAATTFKWSSAKRLWHHADCGNS